MSATLCRQTVIQLSAPWRLTLVSVRRVVPSSEVTTETWEVGVPGSSSMVTVSSTTSCGSCIIARDVALLGLCSCKTGAKEKLGNKELTDRFSVQLLDSVEKNRTTSR